MNFEAKTIQYVNINRAQTMDIVDVGAISFTTRIKADLNVLFANSNLTSGTFDISNTNREQYIENTVSDFNQRLPYYQNTVQNGEFLFFLKHDLQTIFNKNVDVNQSLMNVDLIELNTFKVLNQIVDNDGALNKKFLNSTQLKEICIELQHRNDATDGYSGLTFYSGDSISTIVHIRDSDIAGSPWHIYTLQIDHREGEIVADDVIGTWDNSVSILTNDFWNFYYNWIYDTNDIKSIVPEVDNNTDLGSSVLRFRDIHFAGDLNDSISLSSTAIVPTVSNQTNIGSPTLMFNDIYMNGTMNGYSFTSSAFLPEQNNQTNLGSATFLFKDLYLSGRVNGIKLTDTQVFSVTDDYTNLGTSNFRFKDLYLSGTVNGVSISGGGVNGVSISNSSVNGLVIASDGSSVLPSVSATTDLGSTETLFKNLHLSGNIFANTETSTFNGLLLSGYQSEIVIGASNGDTLSGTRNTVVGVLASGGGYTSSNGARNTVMGYQGFYHAEIEDSTRTGRFNTLIGVQAGEFLTSGSFNVQVGSSIDTTTNIDDSTPGIWKGNCNTLLGCKTKINGTRNLLGLNCSIALGFDAKVTESNQMVIGSDMKGYHVSKVVPGVTDQTDLGTTTQQFKDLYLSGTVNGVSISNSSVNGLVIASDGSSVLPSVSATTDLGSTEKTFKDIYISNTLRFGSASVFLDMYTDDYLNVYPGINVNGLQVTNHNSRKVVFHNETRSAYIADLGMWNRPFHDMYLSGALNNTSISSGTINNIMTIDENNNRVVPVLDSSIDLGNGSLRWNDIYSLNAPINSSDRNLKKNIIDSDLGLDFIEKLRPVRFQFKDGTRPHYGMIAQEVRDVINDMKKDFAGYIQGYQTTKVDILDEKTNEKIGEETETSETPYYALRYTEFIAPLIKSVQELTQRVQELENKLTS